MMRAYHVTAVRNSRTFISGSYSKILRTELSPFDDGFFEHLSCRVAAECGWREADTHIESISLLGEQPSGAPAQVSDAAADERRRCASICNKALIFRQEAAMKHPSDSAARDRQMAAAAAIHDCLERIMSGDPD